MKHLLEVLVGGYPLDDETVAFLQSMHNERDAFLYNVFGDKKKVSGVIEDVQNNIVSDGLITYNGKLYHFVGGTKQTQISLKKTVIQKQFGDEAIKDAFVEEYFSFDASGTDAFAFSELKRFYNNPPQIKEIKILGRDVTNAELAGSGWFLADGANGTDNLVDRFFVVAGSQYNVTDIGGSNSVSLNSDNNGPHIHGIENGGDSDTGFGHFQSDSDNNGSSDLSEARTKSSGLGTPHENRPPYFAVVAIQFMGL
jgi:hypothetical protein